MFNLLCPKRSIHKIAVALVLQPCKCQALVFLVKNKSDLRFYEGPFVKILYLTDLAQKVLSLPSEMLSLVEIAISTCRDVISGRDSYLYMQRCYIWQR